MIGATVTARPSPITTIPAPSASTSDFDETSEKRSIETPSSAGPTVRKSRGPCRSDCLPKKPASAITITLIGTSGSDATNGE